MRKLLSHSLWGRANVGLVSMQCLECTVWGYCLFCCQSVMPVMLWEPSNKLLSKSCGDCWAIRSEAEQCCFVSMQACSVLSVLCGATACFCCQSVMPVMLWEPSNKLLSKSCGDCWAIRSEAEQCCFVSMQACGVLSVLCGATACFVARAWCLWCFENHQINCWANRAEIVEPFALRQSNVVLSACRHAVSWVYSVGLLLVLLPERDACDALRTIK